MKILALGAILEEITPEAMKEEGRSVVLLTNSVHVKEAMEEDVMDGKIGEFQSQIFPIRKQLLILRSYYDELRDMGKELEENENQFFAKKYLEYFGIVADRADRLMGRTVHLLEYAGASKWLSGSYFVYLYL